MWSWGRKPPKDGFPKGFRVQQIGVTRALAVSDLPGFEIAKYFREHPAIAKALVTFITESADGSLRDPGAMIGGAKAPVRGWKFHPASQDGKAVPSRMTASFLYRPPNYGNVGVLPPKSFSPVLPPDQSDSAHGNFVPVGILSFAYPDYPVNSVTSGSVVVQVTVDGAGEVKGVEFLHGMENFNKFVSAALKQWRFQAATFNAKPVTSKTVIAFTFQPPPSG